MFFGSVGLYVFTFLFLFIYYFKNYDKIKKKEEKDIKDNDLKRVVDNINKHYSLEEYCFYSSNYNSIKIKNAYKNLLKSKNNVDNLLTTKEIDKKVLDKIYILFKKCVEDVEIFITFYDMDVYSMTDGDLKYNIEEMEKLVEESINKYIKIVNSMAMMRIDSNNIDNIVEEIEFEIKANEKIRNIHNDFSGFKKFVDNI